MKNFILILLFLGLNPHVSGQTEIIIFNDSQNNSFYDPSWGFSDGQSFLERAGTDNTKFPVETNYVFAGVNSLKLRWISNVSGNWGIAAASIGWTAHDITGMQSITFMLYPDSDILSSQLPLIYLEDLSNQKSLSQNITNYIVNINPGQWNKITIPLEPFFQNPGNADFTKIKTIFFGQDPDDGIEHVIYIDELKFTDGSGSPSGIPSIPVNVSAKGYELHVDISWDLNSEEDLAGYRIYEKDGGNYNLLGIASKNEGFFTHFLGATGITKTYAISAFNSTNEESPKSSSATATTHSMDDEEFINMLQEAVFRYFWDYGHPVSGLTRERSGSGNTVTIGGSGFGIMAIPVGIERGFITREKGAERLIKILDFLEDKAERFHGAWPHWLNGETGKTIPFSEFDDGADLVETSFMIQGLLTIRGYFNQDIPRETEIRETVTRLWEEVEWIWFRKTLGNPYLYWHWSPNYFWRMNLPVAGFNETLITYILGIASPTHAVPFSLYFTGWAGGPGFKNGKSFYGYILDVGRDYGGPLFFTHYSFLGFDPGNKRDSFANYFNHNRNQTLVNRQYCIENPKSFTGYDENTWGLTASDDPWGYRAHEPNSVNDNGTITPSAAISSFPYTPEESMGALKNFYRVYGESLWGIYGFKDAFHPGENWYANGYLAIDQGPILLMIENYRSGLLWENFMSNPEIISALDLIGFKEDISTQNEGDELTYEFILEQNYPNPFNSTTKIKYEIPDMATVGTTHELSLHPFNVRLTVYDILGREIKTLVNEIQNPGDYEIQFNSGNLTSGVYLYKLETGSFIDVKKMIILR